MWLILIVLFTRQPCAQHGADLDFLPAMPAQASSFLVFGDTAYGTLAEDARRQRESKSTIPLKGWVQGGLMETKFNALAMR